MKHSTAFTGANTVMKLKQPSTLPGDGTIRVEDWWDRVSGGVSWMYANGNPAALMYAMRSAKADLPLDDEVVYGKIGGYGHLVHVTELDVAQPEADDPRAGAS